MSTTYTKRGNCIRAARVALGKGAKPGVDFTISGSDGAFTWTAKGKRAKGDGNGVVLSNQPQMKRLIGYCARKSGATIKDLCGLLSDTKQPLQEPTVRGAISRLNDEGNVSITAVREGRIKIYHCVV